jgi:hypothetical protein
VYGGFFQVTCTPNRRERASFGSRVLQEVEGGRKFVAYASRTLTAQEIKASSAYELECLAVVFTLERFRQYLEHQEFLLETDNQILSWFLNHPRQVGKMGRWIVKISSFKFRVQHMRARRMSLLTHCHVCLKHVLKWGGMHHVNMC